MKHLCENCRGINVGNDVAMHKMSLEGEVVRKTLLDLHGVEYLKIKSTENSLGKKPFHLCALILRSLKSPDTIGTSDEEFTLPKGPISLDISVLGEEKRLVAVARSTWGSPITLSFDSG